MSIAKRQVAETCQHQLATNHHCHIRDNSNDVASACVVVTHWMTSTAAYGDVTNNVLQQNGGDGDFDQRSTQRVGPSQIDVSSDDRLLTRPEQTAASIRDADGVMWARVVALLAVMSQLRHAMTSCSVQFSTTARPMTNFRLEGLVMNGSAPQTLTVQ
jgi:hypothetical protein